MTATKQPRNILEFLEDYKKNGGVCRQMYLKVRERTGCSMTNIDRWFKMESQTHNELYLQVLEDITGIDRSNLFRRYAD